ncbi:MAG: hypothetical protein V3U76_18950 [Granulosicoccus sp.]
MTFDGYFAPQKIARLLLTTQEEVARSVGLGKDSIQRKDRVRSSKTQRRLREMIEIINKVERNDLRNNSWPRVTQLCKYAASPAVHKLMRSNWFCGHG